MVVLCVVVAVVVVVEGTGLPFETWIVTLCPFGSRAPPPGFCETTMPFGFAAGPRIAVTA